MDKLDENYGIMTVDFNVDFFVFTFHLHNNSEKEEKSQDSVIPLSRNDAKILRIDDPLGLGD